MADISKIQVPGSATQYNIKDAQARRDIEDVKADLDALESTVDALEPGLSETAKAVLLDCLRHVYYIDNDDNHYNMLRLALDNAVFPQIRATFTPGSSAIYTDDDLNSLKQFLTVKYYETAQSAGVTVNAADYTVSGELVEGRSLVNINYNNLTAPCAITGVVGFNNIWSWAMGDGRTVILNASTDRNQDSLTGVTISDAQHKPASFNINTRRHLAARRGILPYTYYGTSQLSTLYPIPVPTKANKVSVSILPNTQYSYANIVKFNRNNNKYEYYTSIGGWSQGVNERSFAASEDLFLFVNFKYNADGSSYPTEPSSIVIQFEEV